ncbi:MAG: ABC transporter permease [Chloroflexi bacterium]|nr:MAG: ABC transporter permease [Chloroflexota bacterium]
MDTKDQDELASPGVMSPDTTLSPLTIEKEITDNGTVQVIGPDQEQVPVGVKPKKTLTPFQESLRRLRRDKRAMVSLGVIIFFILLPIIGPLIYQHIGGTYNSAFQGSIGPAVYHNPFHGQGLLVSISVALLVEVVDILLGITVGVLAGFYGGWIDQLLARFTDIMFAFPGLLFAILLTGIFGTQADTAFSNIPIIGPNGKARLLLLSLALAFTAWPLMARYVRGQTLQLKEQQFIEAARTSGTSDLKIITRHIIPNLFSIVVVASTLNISGTIIGEAGLSLLGLGVQPPGSSIGLMISDASSGGNLQVHPWEVLLPSIVLTIIVLAFSFLGDGLRDAFDPRSKD